MSTDMVISLPYRQWKKRCKRAVHHEMAACIRRFAVLSNLGSPTRTLFGMAALYTHPGCKILPLSRCHGDSGRLQVSRLARMRMGLGRATLCVRYLRRDARIQWYAGSDFRIVWACYASDVRSSVVVLRVCPQGFCNIQQIARVSVMFSAGRVYAVEKMQARDESRQNYGIG